MGNTHTKFKLDRTRQSGLIVFNEHNFTKSTFLLSFDPKRHWIAPKTVGFMYSSWETHTPSLNLNGPGIRDLSCLQEKIHKIPKIAIFLSFDPKRPWICTKNNRVPVLIVGNTHTKFKLDRTKHSRLYIMFTSKASHTHTHTPC